MQSFSRSFTFQKFYKEVCSIENTQAHWTEYVWHLFKTFLHMTSALTFVNYSITNVWWNLLVTCIVWCLLTFWAVTLWGIPKRLGCVLGCRLLYVSLSSSSLGTVLWETQFSQSLYQVVCLKKASFLYFPSEITIKNRECCYHELYVEEFKWWLTTVLFCNYSCTLHF